MTLAITRSDLADYVSALFIVYIILIFARILLSFLPRVPHSATLRPVLDFVTDTTDPYLNIFRRFLPMVRLGPGALDLSPIVATIVLILVSSIVAGLIRG